MSLSIAGLLPLLWAAVVKTSLVLVAVGAVSYVLRRASAASRFLAWQLGIIGVLSLTISSFVVEPRFHVIPIGPFLFAPRASAGAPSAVDTTDLTSLSQRDTRRHAGIEAGAAMLENSKREPHTSVASPTSRRAVDRTASNSPVTRASRLSLATVLETVWLAGAAFILARLLIGTLATHWLMRRSAPVDTEEWAALTESMSLALGLAHPVSILKSARAATPMTFGVFDPVVLLPAHADEWSQERRRVVLLHELAHVRRFDCLTNVLGTAACALYWFNPLVWFAVHRMSVEGECACDDWVLRAGIKASSYATHLLDLVHTLGSVPTPATALPMAQRSSFEGRLLAILEPRMNRNGVRRGQAALLAGTIAAIALPLSAMTTYSPSAVAQAAPVRQADPRPRAPKADPASKAAEVEVPGRDDSPSPRAVITGGATVADVATAPRAEALPPQQAMPAAALDALIVATKDADPSVRAAAIKTLAQSGDPRVVAALSEALRSDKDPAVRNAAAWGLGNLDDARGVPALGSALKSDADVGVRRTAIWALGEIGDKSASSDIIDALNDRDTEVRKQALWALGEIGDRAAAHSIEHLLMDKDPSVREQAVWALGEMNARESASAIASVLSDSSATVRSEAVWALGEIGDRSSGAALDRVATSDNNERVRETAVWALGEMGDQDAVPALTAALSDTSPRVVATAAWALGEVSPHTAPPNLMSVTSDLNVEVRRNAVWALGKIEDPSSFSALRQALHDSDGDVRRTAMRALARMGDVAAETAIADMLKDPDPSVRKDAAAALGGRNGGPDPRPRPRPQPRPQPRPFGW